MKKLVFAIVLVMAWCASASALNQWQVLSQLTFTRLTGKPVTETIPFSAVGGQATLKVSNKKVSSATVAINGQIVFGTSDFNRNVANLESKLLLNNGQNILEVILKSQPGSQITIEIVQEVAEMTPQIVRVRTANALRAGDIGLVLQGFLQDEKTLSIIPGLDAAKRNQLADMLEDAVIERETDRSRSYRYSWIDESGRNSVAFAMAIDGEGKWIIVSW
jgi:hypothetical protein